MEVELGRALHCPAMARVVVYGATGFTGRLIVSALLEAGVRDVLLSGRDRTRLEALSRRHGGLEYRAADVADAAGLASALRGAVVAIGAAGPFDQIGEPVLASALAAGAHYLDISGEQPFLAAMHERFDAAARAARRVVVSAHAFEFALGCCAGALAAEAPGVTRVDVYYRVAARGLSRGTKYSIFGVLGTRRALTFSSGKLVAMPGWPSLSRVAWPDQRSRRAIAIPGGEALQLPLGHPALIETNTYLVGSLGALLPLALAWCARPALRALRRLGLLARIARLVGGGSEGPSDAERRSQRFQILARGSGGSETSEVLLSGTDAYGTTARAVALGAKQLLEGAPLEVGVVSTDRAFGARQFLAALSAHGIELGGAGATGDVDASEHVVTTPRTG